MKRLSQALVALVVLLLLALAVGEPALELNDQRQHPIPGRAVKVDGNTVHLISAGAHSSKPTVILEGDLGVPAAAWSQFIKELSGMTVVVAWDRPGSGWSPMGTRPHDGLSLVHELHEALKARDNLGPYVQSQDLPGPYLLVGQGLGAAHMRIFASEYPAEVAGLVILDGFPGELPKAELEARLSRLSSDAWKRRLMLHRFSPLEAPAWVQALPPSDRDGSLAMLARVDAPKAEAAELEAMEQTLQDAQKIQSMGSTPLRVLTTDRKDDPDFASHVKQGQFLARLSTEGDHSVVPPHPFYLARNEIDQPGPLLQAIYKAMGLP